VDDAAMHDGSPLRGRLYRAQKELAVFDPGLITIERAGRGTGEHLAGSREGRGVTGTEKHGVIVVPAVGTAEMCTDRDIGDSFVVGSTDDPGGGLFADHLPAVFSNTVEGALFRLLELQGGDIADLHPILFPLGAWWKQQI